MLSLTLDVRRRDKMPIKLKVECVSGMYLEHECTRVLLLPDTASLLDLHWQIQSAVSFGADHPFEFYTANSPSPWADRNWITHVEDWGQKVAAFQETRLADIWPLGRKKLYYWFDFGDRWIFEVRKMRSCRADAALRCPAVLERIGPDPEQYPTYED